jgi:acetyl/propionyl-CoA carboxylase alpha subunit
MRPYRQRAHLPGRPHPASRCGLDGEGLHVFDGRSQHSLRLLDPMAHAGHTEAEGGRLTAPMPGKIAALVARARASRKARRC